MTTVSAGDVNAASRRASLVAMVYAADCRKRDHPAFSWPLHASWNRRIFFQREVCSCPLIIEDVPREHAPQVRFAEDDEVVKAFAA